MMFSLAAAETKQSLILELGIDIGIAFSTDVKII